MTTDRTPSTEQTTAADGKDVAAAARDSIADADDAAATLRDQQFMAELATMDRDSADAWWRRADKDSRAHAAADRARAAADRAAARADRVATAAALRSAQLDDLTGAYRRAAGVARMSGLLGQARRENTPLAVCFVDVDALKTINDTVGHAAGDTALETVSDIIRAHLGDRGVLVRYGGDEFVFALTAPPGPIDIDTVMEPIRDALRARTGLSVSYGYAVSTAGSTVSELIAAADADLYRRRTRRVSTPAPSPLSAVSAAISGLPAILAGFTAVESALGQVCTAVVTAISGADCGAVTLLRKGTPVTVASTDDLARSVDAAQYATGEGPCLEAAVTRTLIRAGAADAAARFPRFSADNASTDINSFLSGPLSVGGEHVGAINLYSREDHGFGHLDQGILATYTSAAETVLLAAEHAATARGHVAGLTSAQDSRAVIEQAKGVLMAVFTISADKAFELLTWRSQHTHVPVRTLSRQLLADIADLEEFAVSTERVGTLLMTAHTRVPR